MPPFSEVLGWLRDGTIGIAGLLVVWVWTLRVDLAEERKAHRSTQDKLEKSLDAQSKVNDLAFTIFEKFAKLTSQGPRT